MINSRNKTNKDGIGQPFKITRHLLSVIGDEGLNDQQDPIRRQFFPSIYESFFALGESDDPLGECLVEVVPHLLHRYTDRVLLIVTNRCAANCRYCFRRHLICSNKSIESKKLKNASNYVASHTEVKEVILSGGDPLMLPVSRLSTVLKAFSSGRALALRIHTRIPVVQPDRVDKNVVKVLTDVDRLRVVIQINHPREISMECIGIVNMLKEVNIPVLTQGVLLRGVNDNPEILVKIWQQCFNLGITPHHLFQPDLVRGTSHFRLNLLRACKIYRKAVVRSSNIPVPDFALDLPGGLGKVDLNRCSISRENSNYYRIEAPDGRASLYPAEKTDMGLEIDTEKQYKSS